MSSGFFDTDDGCSLAYDDGGLGVPVLWQHGLGADRRQPADVFPEVAGFRRITLECRGHGESDLGDLKRLSIAQFATDVVALLDHLGIDKVVVGGISLGAALSLRVAVKFPARVEALILARPAWVNEPAPSTMRPYLSVAQLLRAYGRPEGLRRFEESAELAEVEAISSDNAASLRSFFCHEREQSMIELLLRIPKDGPGVSAEEIAAIPVPTGVIANGEEFVHPLRYAERLRDMIPGATLQIITSKSVDKGLYQSQFRDALASLLQDWRLAR